MKKLKIAKGFLWTSILGLLGFSAACSKGGGDKYGMPTATYKVKGKVVSSETQNEIEGIEAVLECQGVKNMALTDSEGGFVLVAEVFPRNGDTVFVQFSDIDAVQNGGRFQGKKMQIVFENSNFSGGDGEWYLGAAEKNLGEIKLELKQDENAQE